MMVFACSKHLIKVIRKVAKAPNYTVTVMPAGVEWTCDVCTRKQKAIWAVNEF